MNTSNTQSLMSADPRDGLLLPGLDGANPLGFLAALGLFRVLSDCGSFGDLRVSWAAAGGTWVPLLLASGEVPLDENTILTTLAEQLEQDIQHHPARLLDELKDASDEPRRRRAVFEREAVSRDGARMSWMAALASDAAPADSINQLQTTRRDYFYGNLVSVMSRTTSEHLRRSIFHAWDYADALDNQSLHLDPSEDRRHAYQWNKPAGDPGRKSHGGMLGANRLALEAIPLFPSFPEAGTLRTLGFTGNRSTNTRWTWPIWNVAISQQPVRSLLALAGLQVDSPMTKDIELLRARGIVAAYRTYRILVGKTPNFTPAKRIA